MINLASDQKDADVCESEPESLRTRLTWRRLGVGGGVVVVLGGLGAFANMAQLIDLFGRPWPAIVLGVGLLFVLAGVLMLARLWGSRLDGVVLGAVSLIAVGALASGVAAGAIAGAKPESKPPGDGVLANSIGSQTPSTSETSPPSSPSLSEPAGSPESVEIMSPTNGGTVPWKQPVTIKVTNLAAGQFLWLYIRGADTRGFYPQLCRQVPNRPGMFDCVGWYGYELESRGFQFELVATVVDAAGQQALSKINQRGDPFDMDQPPARPIAQSAAIVVRRS